MASLSEVIYSGKKQTFRSPRVCPSEQRHMVGRGTRCWVPGHMLHLLPSSCPSRKETGEEAETRYLHVTLTMCFVNSEHQHGWITKTVGWISCPNGLSWSGTRWDPCMTLCAAPCLAGSPPPPGVKTTRNFHLPLPCFVCLSHHGRSWAMYYCIFMLLRFIKIDPLFVQSSVSLAGDPFLGLSQPYWCLCFHHSVLSIRHQSPRAYQSITLAAVRWAPLTATWLLPGSSLQKSPRGFSATYFHESNFTNFILPDLDTRNVNINCKDLFLILETFPLT